METKLNIWLCRDLTLMGRSLLSKTLGISKLLYTTSMLTVPQEVIKRVQTKLFNFLWKNKKDKVKREVLDQEMRKGGINFPNFAITVKALRLSGIGRLLEKNNCGDAWKAIPNAFFEKYGGLNFLLKCNYYTKKLDKSVSRRNHLNDKSMKLNTSLMTLLTFSKINNLLLRVLPRWHWGGGKGGGGGRGENVI